MIKSKKLKEKNQQETEQTNKQIILKLYIKAVELTHTTILELTFQYVCLFITFSFRYL